MDIIIENESDFEFNDYYNKIVFEIIDETLKQEHFHNNIYVGINIVSDLKIKDLNDEFRGINKITDVLSFPLIEAENVLKEFSSKDMVFLGDIVIAINKAIEQKNEYGHSLERELAFLIAHSMLHLLGYDHMNVVEEKIMYDKQECILKSKGYLR